MADYYTVEFYCDTGPDEVIATVDVLNGFPVTLNATVDLPLGNHQVFVRIRAGEPGDTPSYRGVLFQIIEGQPVSAPGCRPSPPPPEPT